MLSKISLKKVVGVTAATVVGLSILVNSFTIVAPTETKVKVCFGKVDESKVFTSGTHLVNPFCSFDTFNTGEQKYEVNDLSIPTQDRFNSSANVTVLFNIIPSGVIQIRNTYGNEKTFIETSLRQQLRGIIRDEGRKIKDSRGLAQSDNISNMQENAGKRLIEVLQPHGMDIRQVLVQDINFDSRIAQQILDTQQRIQKEEAETSQTRITQQLAEQKRASQAGISDANKIEADAKAYGVRQQAEAEAHAAMQRADAERYGIEQVAIANEKLTKSLTSSILEKQRLDNEAILFTRSVGNVPTTVIGETDLRAYGIPLTAK